jgi:hypothetical protein
MGGGHEGDLAKQPSLLQVTVGDGPRHVVRGDEPVLDVLREWEAPHDGTPSRVEVDSTHAHLGCVSRSEEGRFLGDDLGQVRRAVAQACGERGEGVHVVS